MYPTHLACPPATFTSLTLRRWPAALAAWSLATYSLPAHKEFRFLLPALQLLMPYCGLAAARALGGGGASSGASSNGAAVRAQRKANAAAAPRPQRSRLWRWGAGVCIALQLPLAAYMLLVHQG